MSDDYLWDGTGKPDAEVQGLENLLSRFRHSGRPLDLSKLDLPSASSVGFRHRFWVGWRSLSLAGAAVTVVLIACGWYVYVSTRPAWIVQRLEGTPEIGWHKIQQAGRFVAGESLETDANSRANINASNVGEVEVEPNSRVRLIRTHATGHRLALDRGTIHAVIWAPPRFFSVETPAGLAVDLGCRYTLHVDPDGSGLLQVLYGWVAFEHGGHESFVPAGAMCATRPAIGPGTPHEGSASPELRAALRNFDFVPPDSPDAAGTRRAALDIVLGEARRGDALTLWHLLSRTDANERARVYDRLAQLVPPPSGVTRDGLVAGDPSTQREMRDLWWGALGFGDTSWWRMWKGPVPGR